jgi:hypothetical protein
MGGMAFTTSKPPNSDVPDLLASCEPLVPPPPNYQFNCDLETMPMMGASHAAARSSHVSGVIAVMVDGSTHFVEENIDPLVWKNLGTRRGGVPADLPLE